MEGRDSQNTQVNYVSSSRAAQLTTYTQDYIGQLCRDGRIDCKRLAGEWQVRLDTLLAYKARFNPDFGNRVTESSSTSSHTIAESHEEVIEEGGRKYIASAVATRLTGYTQDYIGQLARSGVVEGKKVGRKWFIDRQSLLQHKEHNDSLLAALQAQSVGVQPKKSVNEAVLDTVVAGDAGTYTPVIHKVPIVRYHREDGLLLPGVAEYATTESDTLTPPVVAFATHTPEVHLPPIHTPGATPVAIRRDVRDRTIRYNRDMPVQSRISGVGDTRKEATLSGTPSSLRADVQTAKDALTVRHTTPSSVIGLFLSTMIILTSGTIALVGVLQPDILIGYSDTLLRRVGVPETSLDANLENMLSWSDGVSVYMKGE